MMYLMLLELFGKNCIITAFFADFTVKKHLKHGNPRQVRVSLEQDLSRLRFLLADLRATVVTLSSSSTAAQHAAALLRLGVN